MGKIVISTERIPKHFWKLENKLEQTPRSLCLPVPEEYEQQESFCSCGGFSATPVIVTSFLWGQPEVPCSAPRKGQPGILCSPCSLFLVCCGERDDISCFNLGCLTLWAELEWVFCRGLSWNDEEDGIDLSCTAKFGLLFLLNVEFLMLLKCLDALIIKVPLRKI